MAEAKVELSQESCEKKSAMFERVRSAGCSTDFRLLKTAPTKMQKLLFGSECQRPLAKCGILHGEGREVSRK